MSVNVNNLRSKFTNLKFEQLLADKYFVDTCFSKKYDSRPKKEELRDLLFKIGAYGEIPEGITKSVGYTMKECEEPTTTTSTTSTTTSGSTTTTTTS